jgi:hypothetical protein
MRRIKVVERVGLVVEFLAQTGGDPGDSAPGNGRVLGKTNILTTGDGEPLAAVVGNGGESGARNDAVEDAGDPGARSADELGCGLGGTLGLSCEE